MAMHTVTHTLKAADAAMIMGTAAVRTTMDTQASRIYSR